MCQCLGCHYGLLGLQPTGNPGRDPMKHSKGVEVGTLVHIPSSVGQGLVGISPLAFLGCPSHRPSIHSGQRIP
jgi:hypothetical protein